MTRTRKKISRERPRKREINNGHHAAVSCGTCMRNICLRNQKEKQKAGVGEIMDETQTTWSLHTIDDRFGFKQMLRMSPEELNILLEKVGFLITKKDTKMRETFQSLSFQYRMGASTVSNLVRDTCDALHLVLKEDHLKICLCQRGHPSRASDAGLFAHSDLFAALERGLLNIPPSKALQHTDQQAPYVFVGDDAYPLRSDLMKPYSHQQLDHNKRIFNYRLSVVENAFGILASRWRVFRSTIALPPDKVTKITMAAVCLHNFLKDCRSEAYVPPGFVDSEDLEHRVVEGDWRREGLASCKRT
ncbi:hypothetical protein WMY93_011162 [Mugilogobius chulae]|uniref:DDE Tnp4 domain-containing protein n=1 Tax=Mugilogobius chulae TaxID=88201 RepID=A0AAW0P524_9GOBI